MRWLLVLWMVLACAAARCEDAPADSSIVAVLQRSQQSQLDAMARVDSASPRARKVRASFDKLVRDLQTLPPTELRIVRGDVVGEALQGRVVVANIALADLPEGERLFILAHELGHVALGHWAQMCMLYLKWVPGEVVQQQTDAIADRLGREASALSYRQEFEADAFGLRTVRALGVPDEDVMAAFMRFGSHGDTATHPGTRRRIAALRSMAPDWLEGGAQP